MSNTSKIPEHDTLLWCFASNCFEKQIATLNGQFRELRIFGPVIKPVRPWWTSIAGLPFLLGACITGYNNSVVLAQRTTIEEQDTLDRKLKQLKKKHPKWSEERIKHVLDEAKLVAERKLRHDMSFFHERVAILKALCETGPITLLFDDGGSISPELGGTHGLDYTARVPRISESYSINIADSDNYNRVIYLPYWTPVKYHAGYA